MEKNDRGICQEQIREWSVKEDENFFLNLLRCPQDGESGPHCSRLTFRFEEI